MNIQRNIELAETLKEGDRVSYTQKSTGKNGEGIYRYRWYHGTIKIALNDNEEVIYIDPTVDKIDIVKRARK